MKDEFDQWARFFSGNSSEEERVAIQSWIDARMDHQEYAAEMQELWESLSARKPATQSRDASASWNAVLERARKEGQNQSAKERPPVRRTHRRRPAFRTGILFSAVLVFAFLFFVLRDAGQQEDALITYVSERGERIGIRLNDRSMAYLSVDSKLTVPEKFESGLREVELEGEAYFEVTADENRPFMVHAGGASVRVLGTEFNLRSYESDETVTLVVTEGRVSLSERGEQHEDSALVVAGQWGRYAEGQAIQVEEYANIDKELGWREGRLNFVDNRLDDITRELERWYKTEFSFQEEHLKEIKLTASFDLKGNEPLGNVLDIIAQTADVSCIRGAGTVVISR